MKKMTLAVAIAAASIGLAEAASFGGRAGGSIGARSSYSAPRASTPSAPAASAPYSAPAPVASTGSSALGTFAAAAGGAAVGSVVGNALSGGHESTTVINSAPAPVVSAPVAQAGVVQPAPVVPSPVVYQAPATVSTWSWFGQTLGLLAWLGLLGGAAYGAYRLYSLSKRKREIDTGEFLPAAFFLDIQHELAAGDLAKLRVKLTPEMLKMAEKIISGGSYECGITSVSYDYVYSGGSIMEIHYQAEDKSDGEVIDEIWKLKWVDGRWLLAGITTRND